MILYKTVGSMASTSYGVSGVCSEDDSDDDYDVWTGWKSKPTAQQKQNNGSFPCNPMPNFRCQSQYNNGGGSFQMRRNIPNPRDQGTATPTRTNRRKPTLPVLRIPGIDTQTAASSSSELNSIWRQNKGDLVKHVHAVFDRAPNPYALGLYLTTRSPDFLSVKESKEDSLAICIVSGLQAWLERSDSDSLAKQHLTKDIQMVAFQMLSAQRNPGVLRMAFNIYRLESMKDKFIEWIKHMCIEKHFKEACVCATALDLHSFFTVHDFVIPLIFQSREAIAEDFLSGSKDRQNELLHFLDELIASRSLGNTIQNYIRTHVIPDVKMEKLNNKPLEKLLKRLIGKFQADPKTCPHTKRKQRFGALHHLICRRYSDGVEMNEESFMEMLEQTVRDDSQLQGEAMHRIRMKGDKVTAAKFALRLALPLHEIPNEILEEMHRLSSNIVPNPLSLSRTQQSLAEEEDWETYEDDLGPPSKKASAGLIPANPPSSPYQPNMAQKPSNTWETNSIENTRPQLKKCYSLPLSEHDIKIVTTPAEMYDLIQYIDDQVKEVPPNESVVVGFDAEWKPMFPDFSGAALVQLAFKNSIYLIDIIQLKECKEMQLKENESFWKMFKISFFANKKVIKVSYDIKNDLKMLGETVSAWKDIKSEYQTCVDLCVLEKDILRKDLSFFPYSNEPSTDTGLSELVRLCLGFPLNKEDQFSNWEKRPLRQSQIIYAATDVYCLLELFKFLTVDSKILNEEMFQNVNNFVQAQLSTDSLTSPSERSTKKPSTIAYAKEVLAMSAGMDNTHLQSKQPAGNVAFVCDNMLQGLGKKLRACGLDTVIIRGFESHDLGVYYATNENRCLLTKGATFDQITDLVSPNQAYKVSSESVLEQLREIMSHYNIVVTAEDLFSRCQGCNTLKFIQVPGQAMKQILIDLGVNINRKFTDRQRILAENSSSQEGMITYSNQNGQISRRWELLPPNSVTIINDKVLKTPSNAVVEVGKIPLQFLESIENVYICDYCGKCYWESLELENQLFSS